MTEQIVGLAHHSWFLVPCSLAFLLALGHCILAFSQVPCRSEPWVLVRHMLASVVAWVEQELYKWGLLAFERRIEASAVVLVQHRSGP